MKKSTLINKNYSNIFNEIKAVFFDLDGTLFNSKGEVLTSSLESLDKLKKNGYLVGIATGRDPISVKNHLKKWKLNQKIDLIVGMGGSEIYFVKEDELITTSCLEPSLIKEIMDHYQDMDLSFTIPTNGKMYAFSDNEYTQKIARADDLPLEIVSKEEFLKTSKPKLIIVCDNKNLSKVANRAKTFNNNDYYFTSLITNSFLYEYMPKDVSKSKGITIALKRYGYSLDNVLAFGDQDNDIDMIKNARVGVIMENGSNNAKKIADYITMNNDSDGISNFIDNYLFKK